MAILGQPSAATPAPAARQNKVEAKPEAPLQAATPTEGARAGQVRPVPRVGHVVEAPALAAAPGGRAKAMAAARATRARLGLGQRPPLPAEAAGTPAIGVAPVVGGAIEPGSRRRGSSKAGGLRPVVGPGPAGARLGRARAVPVRKPSSPATPRRPVRVAAVQATSGTVTRIAPAGRVAGVAAVAVMDAARPSSVAGAPPARCRGPVLVEARALLPVANGAPAGVGQAHPRVPIARAHVPVVGPGAGVATGAVLERPSAVPVHVGATRQKGEPETVPAGAAAP